MYIGLGTILLLIAGAFLFGYAFRKKHETEDQMINDGDARLQQMKQQRAKRSGFWKGF